MPYQRNVSGCHKLKYADDTYRRIRRRKDIGMEENKSMEQIREPDMEEMKTVNGGQAGGGVCFCRKCRQYIRASEFLIHSMQCKGGVRSPGNILE